MPEIMAQHTDIPESSILTAKVHRILGLNPSWFTGPGTNTYLVGMDGDEPLLIDSGSGVPQWLTNLSAHLNEHSHAQGQVMLQRFIATHGHGDHIGGIEQLASQFQTLTFHKCPWPGRNEDSEKASWHPLNDGDEITGAGYTLRAVHCPGHAPDHLCYYLEEEKALFSGDVILGVGTTVIPKEGGSLQQYLDSLRRLLTLDIERIYPGHGPVITDGPAKIQSSLDHRLEREKQIIALLQADDHTVPELVAVMYKNYPQALHAAAAQSVSAHLEKLYAEARVQKERLLSAGEQTGDGVERDPDSQFKWKFLN